MPLYKLIEEMPHDEMVGWFAFLERRPIGWREDLRTSYLIQAQGSKQKPTEIFPSLKAVMRRSSSSDPMDSLKTSAIFQGMLSAVGGDKLECLYENEDQRN
jgi:hypothetical protein